MSELKEKGVPYEAELKRKLKSKTDSNKLKEEVKRLSLKQEPPIKVAPTITIIPRKGEEIETKITRIKVKPLPLIKPKTSAICEIETERKEVEVKTADIFKSTVKPKIKIIKLDTTIPVRKPQKTEIPLIKPLKEIKPKPMVKTPPKLEPLTPLQAKPIKLTPLPSTRKPKVTPVEIKEKLPVVIPKPVEEITPSVKFEEEFEPYSAEVFGLPEGLLDESSEFVKGGGLFGSLSPERLVCIIADKAGDFHEFIELLCSLLLRIKGEGLPSVYSGRPTETFLEYKRREDLIMLDKVNDLLQEVVAKVKSGGNLSALAEHFGNQLKSLRLEQAFRFLVLPTERSEIQKVKDILTNPRFEFRYHIPILYIYKRRDLEPEKWVTIFQGMFGFLKPTPITTKPGNQLLELDNEFYRKLEEIREKVKRRLSSQKQPIVGEELNQPESWLHYTLKFFVIKHLIDNENIPEENIETEYEIQGLRSDIYVKSPREIAVEIETFYGTVDPFNLKLIPKLKKYAQASFRGELWLVIPNIQALLYVDDLLKLRKDFGRELNIKIYVLDLTGGGSEVLYGEKRDPGLIELVDILKMFRENGLTRHPRFLK